MIDLRLGDCLEIMKDIPDNSIDMVLCDPPYGTSECKWDTVIPFEPMWEQLRRVTKPNAAIVIFGHELFTAKLKLSNIEMYRYSLVWQKSRVSRFAQAKNRFLNTHEDIVVFSRGKCSSNSKILMKFFPQGLQPYNKKVKDTSYKNGHRKGRRQLPDFIQEFTGYPKSILKFGSVSKTIHPTEKPVSLLKYLIESYTGEGDTVLDFASGSGSTGEAAANAKRNAILIEKDKKYFETAKKRIYEL